MFSHNCSRICRTVHLLCHVPSRLLAGHANLSRGGERSTPVCLSLYEACQQSAIAQSINQLRYRYQAVQSTTNL